MIDSPFLRKDAWYWPLVAACGISSVGIAFLGIGFGLASFVLSGGQITQVQTPDRSAIVPWPIFTPPAGLTIVAAGVALVAILVLCGRTTVRTRGTLSTVFRWALAGQLGAGALGVAFPDATVGEVDLVPGLSDHWGGWAGFTLAAVISVVGLAPTMAAAKAARAAGVNPGFLTLFTPQGTSLVPELTIEAPAMWRWTTEHGLPSIVPEDHRPSPVRIVVPDREARRVTDPEPQEAVVHQAPARRERIPDGSGGTTMRYRYASPTAADERIVDVRIRPTADRHELRAYIDCADLIAGSVQWAESAPAAARKRRWWARG